MKKALMIILLVIFGIGIYMNFGMGKSVEEATIKEAPASTASAEPPSEEGPDEEEAPQEEPETAEATNEEDMRPFNQEALNGIHEEAVAENEPVIIDVVIPSYYTEDFIDLLTQQFGKSRIEFNRVDLDAASPGLETLTVNENSDGVIIDALQIMDYNQEALPDRAVERLEDAYMKLHDAGKVVYLLGNPNVHQHENLAQVLEADAEHFPEHDYYYIDNQDITVEDAYYDYDSGTLTGPVETRIAQNIHEYMIE